jgi:hypothetical protein
MAADEEDLKADKQQALRRQHAERAERERRDRYTP